MDYRKALDIAMGALNQQDLPLLAAADYLLNSPHNEHTLHGELTSVTVSAHAWEQLRLAFEKQKASL